MIRPLRVAMVCFIVANALAVAGIVEAFLLEKLAWDTVLDGILLGMTTIAALSSLLLSRQSDLIEELLRSNRDLMMRCADVERGVPLQYVFPHPPENDNADETMH